MESFFIGIEEALATMGPWGAVLAVLLMTAVSILPFPAEAPAMINGMLFGPVLGSILTALGAFAGAVISFELAQALGRPLAAKVVPEKGLARVDELVARAGWGGLLLARLIPVIAFTALNWGAGLTSVPRGRFLWTTAIGILPGAIAFTVFGSAVPALLVGHPVWTTVFSVAFLLAIVAVSARAGGYTTVEVQPDDA